MKSKNLTYAAIGALLLSVSVKPANALTISVRALQAMEFPRLPIPANGRCEYRLTPGGIISSENQVDCLRDKEFARAAVFEIDCKSQQLLRIEAFVTSDMPDVLLDLELPNILIIDDQPAEGRIQFASCDFDGVTSVFVGGRIVVSAADTHLTAKSFGTVHLEVSYAE